MTPRPAESMYSSAGAVDDDERRRRRPELRLESEDMAEGESRPAG